MITLLLEHKVGLAVGRTHPSVPINGGCSNKDASHFVCCLAKGHRGAHIAHVSNDEAISVWGGLHDVLAVFGEES